MIWGANNMEELRTAHFTINLTEKEAQKIIKLAKKERRKTSEFIYLLLADLLAKTNDC